VAEEALNFRTYKYSYVLFDEVISG